MQDFVFIFLTVFVTTGLIYFVYKFILDLSNEKEDELQITENDLIEQLNILFKEKKYFIIENLAKKYLEKKFANDDVRLILARSLFESGKFYDAIEQARVIARHRPRDFEIKNFIVNCYLNVSKPLEAINILKDILEVDENNGVAIKEIAQIYLDTNQKISALKMFKKLEGLVYSNQEKLNIKTIVAGIHIEFLQFEDAIREYQEILEIYPANMDIKKNLVALYKLNSDFERQVEVANEIYEAHTNEENDIWALGILSDAYYENKNYDNSLEYAKKLEEIESADKIEVQQKIAKILIALDKVDESIEILKKLIIENQDNLELKKSLATAYQAKDDYESAIGVYKVILDASTPESAKDVHSEISIIYSNWAMYLFNQKDNENCFKKFNSALEYDTNNPDIYYRLGLINKTIKNYNEAIVQLKMAIDLDNEKGDYYYALSECYGDIDNKYEEKNTLMKAAQYNEEENNANVYYKLALIYEAQTDPQSAMNYINKAIAINENFIDAKYKLALMLEHNGDREGAIDLYKNILALDPTYSVAEDNLKMLTAS